MQPERFVTCGLVLRETVTRDADKILTVLTLDRGRLSVIARGARRKGSRVAAACQLLAWTSEIFCGAPDSAGPPKNRPSSQDCTAGSRGARVVTRQTAASTPCRAAAATCCPCCSTPCMPSAP